MAICQFSALSPQNLSGDVFEKFEVIMSCDSPQGQKSVLKLVVADRKIKYP